MAPVAHAVVDANQDGSWAFRRRHPCAWPEVGGNTFPRCCVIAGGGQKRKGLEYTDMEVEAGTGTGSMQC